MAYDNLAGWTWTGLWSDTKPRGQVHVHVEYEPYGIEPAPNDVVYLESFVRCAVGSRSDPVLEPGAW